MNRFLIDLARRILPPHRREWGDAMQAELATISDRREATGFALGCLWAALSERITAMKMIVAVGRLGVGLVSLLTGGLFLICLPNAVMIMLGLQPDSFHDMLIRHHHMRAAADHVRAYPYMLAFASLMAVSYIGAGIFLIRWQPRPFAVFCALAALPAVGLTLAGLFLRVSGQPLSYAWPFIPLTLLVVAAVFLDWLSREPARDHFIPAE